MIVLASLVVALLAGLAGMQTLWVASFVRSLRGFDIPLIRDDQAPRAVVMLCLRGTDPFLKKCLMGVLTQDYPSYQVRIVIDSAEDPAHPVVAEVLEKTGATHVRVENLRQVRSECSLKCSSMRQILDSLEPDFEIVAQLDADTIAHKTWLRELATALAPPDVGLATGNRWYMPLNPGLGSIVRYIWNAGAVVQMHWHEFAWGGCFAIKRRVLKESNLLRRWGRAFCDDTVLIIPVRKLGLRVAFVSNLMMINRENISLGAFYHWVCRQMLNVRLYHPAWPAVVLHGIVSAIIPVIALGLLFVALLQGNVVLTRMMISGLAIYGASLLLFLLPMVKAMRAIAARRGEPTRWISGWRIVNLLLTLPIAQCVQTIAIFSALYTKSTSWRGIRYSIEGRWKVRMEEYSPYQSQPTMPQDQSLG